jgi:hypothetical protein
MAGLMVCLWLVEMPTAVSFATSAELRDLACANGLQTCNDGTNNATIFFIADHPISRNEIGALVSRRDAGLTPRWRGIVWAAQIRTAACFMDPEQGFGGHWRVWGNVIVAGDVQLMDRIEAIYRSQ